jgi:hypothetical protein
MRKNNSKERKIEKNAKSHHGLGEFYTEEQKREEQEQKQLAHKKKTIQDTEMEIFEHLKNHTKKILKK